MAQVIGERLSSHNNLSITTMPTIACDKAELWQRLGREYTTDEFDQLCFDYGLELDEDTTEEVEALKKQGLPVERPQLKIEIPANRYDLLCIEGIARALRVYLGLQPSPKYELVYPADADIITTTVHPETARVRPLFACAVLRNVSFTPQSYASFIELQDKLHQNICRRRQLVAIGTHDLDTLKPPFRYEARAPKDIKFTALGKSTSHTAEELMTIYESEKHLSKYLPIIRDSPVYPIIYDTNDTVLSMPPIINSEHSKITLNTRNIFIDVTATDQTKLDIVVNIVATMFSEYCEKPYTIEPVRVVLPDGTSKICPDLSMRHTVAHTSYINSCTGLSLTGPEASKLLSRMSLISTVSTEDADKLLVEIPPTRPDIFHECDIMEDAAIAYGFNNLPDTFPSTSTVAQPLAISRLSEIVRREWAMSGWIESLTFTLCSLDENFSLLNHTDDGKKAVKIANPKTLEFQVIRTSLLPGLLKVVRENKSHSLPIKAFEVSDVVFKDVSKERQARNERHAAAVWCNKSAGFEIVHGMLDRVMKILEVKLISKAAKQGETGYYIKEAEDPTYFPGRAAKIFYRPPQTQPDTTLDAIKGALISKPDMEIGTLGVLHPTVLQNFDIGYPCSALEFSLEPFKKSMYALWTNEDS